MSRLIDPVLGAELLEMIEHNTLPEDFDQWDICDENGWSVAHIYTATYGQLPEGFNQWDLTTSVDDITVAHVAIIKGTLPNDFDQWELTDNKGWTVAHIAARFGKLPSNFSRWNLVATINNITVAHTAAVYNTLPFDFDQWALVDDIGWTVAHQAANSQHLPKGFHLTHPDIWKMKDCVGMSVEELAALRGYDESVTVQ